MRNMGVRQLGKTRSAPQAPKEAFRPSYTVPPYAVVAEGATILELLTGEDQALLIGRD